MTVEPEKIETVRRPIATFPDEKARWETSRQARWRRKRIAVGGGLAAAALGGLATLRAAHAGVNYENPRGPRYAGRPPVEASDPRPDALVVATFNIRYARRIDAAAEILRSQASLQEADLIALQEMDEAGASRLARALGFHWVYYPAAVHPRAGAEGRGGDFGNAVLSRWPITDDYKLVLPGRSFPQGLRRIAVAADIAAPGGPIRVYSVHLETPFAMLPADRAAQIGAILQDAAGSPAGAVIVAGDFNGRGAAGQAFASRGFDWPTRNAAPTVRGFAWDHVFGRGLPEAPTAGVGVDLVGASDHRPVWVHWRLR